MGMTYANVRVSGPVGDEEVRMLVDTGSLLTWVSKETLGRLGISPTGTKKFRTIDGMELVRRTGGAILEVMGEKAPSIVVFAEERDAEVLGVVSLEGLGLELDPGTKTLKKTEIFAAYLVA